MRAIDGDALYTHYEKRMCFESHRNRAYLKGIRDCMKDLSAQPTIEPEREKGKWIIDGHHIRCDNCGEYMCDTDREGDAIPRNFCPNCGADMRGES